MQLTSTNDTFMTVPLVEQRYIAAPIITLRSVTLLCSHFNCARIVFSLLSMATLAAIASEQDRSHHHAAVPLADN